MGAPPYHFSLHTNHSAHSAIDSVGGEGQSNTCFSLPSFYFQSGRSWTVLLLMV